MCQRRDKLHGVKQTPDELGWSPEQRPRNALLEKLAGMAKVSSIESRNGRCTHCQEIKPAIG